MGCGSQHNTSIHAALCGSEKPQLGSQCCFHDLALGSASIHTKPWASISSPLLTLDKDASSSLKDPQDMSAGSTALIAETDAENCMCGMVPRKLANDHAGYDLLQRVPRVCRLRQVGQRQADRAL